MSTNLNASHVWDAASAPSVLDPRPTSRDEVRARHMALYQHGIETGRFEVYVWPYWMLHIVLFVLYFILVPPSWLDAKAARSSAWRRGRRWMLLLAKYPLFLVFAWQAFHIMSACKSPTGFMAPMNGMHMFVFWWFAALFIFRDSRFDCLRLERERIVLDASSALVHSQASTTGATGHGESGPGVRSRCGVATKAELPGTSLAQESRGEYRYYWQGLPPTLGHRAAWTLDLIASPRGAGWAHQIRTLPVLPPEALARIPASWPRLTAKPTCLGLQGPNARARLLRKYLATLAACYVTLDLFQSLLVMHDPFFWGLVDAPFPPGLLPRALSESPAFVRGLRTLASGIATGAALDGAWTAILTVLLVCTRSESLKAEPWLWADLFGDPRAVLDHGLAGLWGEWWHQVFRIAFTAPSDALSSACGWDRRDPRARATAMATAFFISGTIHAAGSYTLLGDNQPFEPFLFFALQPVGIMIEMLAGSVCARLGLRLPAGCVRVVRGVWVCVFLAFTGPLFADDLAKGGSWLTEHLPFSFVRGLRLGPAGSG